MWAVDIYVYAARSKLLRSTTSQLSLPSLAHVFPELRACVDSEGMDLEGMDMEGWTWRRRTWRDGPGGDGPGVGKTSGNMTLQD